jgi:hypothetical protein
MRGKKAKELRALAQRLHLRLLVDNKIKRPEGMEEARAQVKWLYKTLKRNWKKLSVEQKNALPASTPNSIDSAWPDERQTTGSSEPVVL